MYRETTLKRYRKVVGTYNEVYSEYREKYGDKAYRFKPDIFEEVAERTDYTANAVRTIYNGYLKKKWR